MHQPAVAHRRQQKRQRQLMPQHARPQAALRNDYGMTRTKRYVLKHTAIFAKRDFAFGTTIQIVEDRPRQAAVCDRTKISDTDYARRCYRAGGAGHGEFQVVRGSYRTRERAIVSPRPASAEMKPTPSVTGASEHPPARACALRPS